MVPGGLTRAHGSWSHRPMKFEDRALVKVYMERRDVERVEVVAGKAGVAEWVRNLILRKLENGSSDEKDVQRAGDLGMGRGRTGARAGRATLDGGRDKQDVDRKILSGVADVSANQGTEVVQMRGGAEAARLAHNQEVTGSSPVPATKISLEDVVQETRGKQKEYGSLEHRIARRTGHPVGHECLECMGALRFEESLDRAEKESKKEKKSSSASRGAARPG